jgi:hypothetical protein
VKSQTTGRTASAGRSSTSSRRRRNIHFQNSAGRRVQAIFSFEPTHLMIVTPYPVLRPCRLRSPPPPMPPPTPPPTPPLTPPPTPPSPPPPITAALATATLFHRRTADLATTLTATTLAAVALAAALRRTPGRNLAPAGACDRHEFDGLRAGHAEVLCSRRAWHRRPGSTAKARSATHRGRLGQAAVFSVD